MKNVLHWNPPEGLTGIEALYTVQYFIYGQRKWLDKPECRNINRTHCDLSAETSDYEHQYYARVKAIWKANCSKWAETRRFYPYLETQIGPPAIALTTDEKSILIILTAPEKWKRNSEEGSVSMQQIFPTLKYNVSVYNTKSNRMWVQCVTNHSLVRGLEPDTQYCVRVESLVLGPPRLTQPSEKQCVSTLKDQASALKIKIIFYYVLPVSVAMFIFAAMGYSMYKYIHVGKEKHPKNLVLIYESEFHKRFFEPAEKLVINFITFGILDDSRTSHKDLTEASSGGSNHSHPKTPEGQEPHQEEDEVTHLGYASHVMEVFCDPGENTNGPSLTQQRESLSRTRTMDEMVLEYEYDVTMADIPVRTEDREFDLPGEVCKRGKLVEQLAPLANLGRQTLLYPCAPQFRGLGPLKQMCTDPEKSEEEPSTTLVDWDPQTGRLFIPLLADSGAHGYSECGQLTEGDLLSRLYEEQATDKLLEENETYLMQFMADWGLCVQMQD
ncbi:PREDICTED: interleukin-20 receptor subunit alpha [Elephantulus edwardii]|uniref:interleukin-20 receptor subunit alpha n=1 Tax=Elephantulus edwardii TaxID=28737 RepID=UPI0003F096D8|nr:PREDICTED: interleukin-20 receptor subunit alpha [Elephantulus edwardii]